MEKAQSRGFLIFEGLLFLFLGFFALSVPQFFTLGLELIIGWLFIIAGISQGYRAIKATGYFYWVPLAVSALLYLVVGVLMLVYPLRGMLTLTMLVTFFFICDGVIKITRGIQLRNLNNNWGWLVFNGLISLVMAGIIITGWPITAVWVIGLLIGINMVFFGITLLFLGFKGSTQNSDYKAR